MVWSDNWGDWQDRYWDEFSAEEQADFDALMSDLSDSWDGLHFDPDMVEEINDWLDEHGYDVDEFWAEYYA